MLVLFAFWAALASADWSTLSQTIDHFSDSPSCFDQRDFISSPSPNPAPIILFVGGAENISTSRAFSPVVDGLVNLMGGILVALEHRFYGNSHPTDLTSENLSRYLNTGQALEDLAQFVESLRRNISCDHISCPVLVIGDSYGGTLASYFRLDYPQFADYAWASSSPLLLDSTDTSYSDFVDDTFRELALSFGFTKAFNNTAALFEAFDKNCSNETSPSCIALKNSLGLNDQTDPISVQYLVANSVAALLENCAKNSSHFSDF
jgi:pimeloyl-ACP methyl ester carboxylesterase